MVAKGEIPFVRLLIPLLAGIILAWYQPGLIALKNLLLLLVLLLIIFTAALYLYKRLRLFRIRGIIGMWVQLLLLLAAYGNTVNQLDFLKPDYFAKHPARTLLISICSEPQVRNDIARFECSVHAAGTRSVSGKLLIALKVDTIRQANFSYGDLLLIPAQYHEVEPPYNPGEFNFKHYLRTHQIEYQSFINQQQVLTLGSGYGNPFVAFALALRRKIVASFRKHIPDTPAAALASTLIMGYRADLSPEVLQAYANTGTLHVLSVSGMHVALVFVLLGFLLRPLDNYRKLRVFKALVLLAMMWFYAMLSGFSPSVNRAALMLSLVVLGKALNRRMNTYNLLAISAFFLLLYNPFYLFDIGFQLSYLAVLGLVALQRHINSWLYFKARLPGMIWSYIALSISAQLFTFPLSLWVFHQFPLSFLLSNLLIVLPVTLLMYVGVLFVLLMPFGIGLDLLGKALMDLINFTNQSLFYIEKLPYASLKGLTISVWQMLLLYVVVLCLLWALMQRSKLALWISLFTLLLVLADNAYAARQINKQHKIVFYSLRKNLAIAFFKGKQYDLLTDLKPGEKAEQFSIQPSLTRAGLYLRKRLNPYDLFYEDDFCSNGKLLQFGTYRLFRWTADENFKTHTSPLKVNAVLLSGNPKITIEKLKLSLHFQQILIDATNPDYKIRQWIEEAKALQIPVYVLKKNPALQIDLQLMPVESP